METKEFTLTFETVGGVLVTLEGNNLENLKIIAEQIK